MRASPSVAILCLSIVTVVAAACSSDEDAERAHFDSAKAAYDSAHGGGNARLAGTSFSARDSSRELGPGDVIITDRDSSLDLLLVGDHIATRFSAKTMAKIRKETDTTANKSSGFAASIEKMVKSTVQTQLSKEVRYQVSDIREARYEDGRIVIETKDGTRLFKNTKVNDRRLDESFAPDDAQRFVDAVNARIKSR